MPRRFIGRARELEVARDALDAAAVGQGGVLVVSGEPGIGKSRLALEIASLARDREMDVVWSAGWSGGGAGAYWPWTEVLAALDSPEGEALELASRAPDSERFGRFRSVLAMLRRRAAERPLVIVIDDAHAIDADGLRLTRFVARGLVGHRLLLLLAHRATSDIPLFATALLGEIDREASVVRLRGLAEDEVRELLAAHGDSAESTVVQRVHDLTDGNPFLVQQVLDAGLHRQGGPAPQSTLRLLGPQLDALDSTSRDAVETAAILGPTPTLSELALVLGTDHHTLERARADAVSAGLVRSEPSTAFAFTHELAREAILSRLAPEELAGLHRRCLLAMEPDDHSPERAARRARHALELAGFASEEAPRAVDIARSSATVLLAHNAPEAAVELLRGALAAHEASGAAAPAPLLNELGAARLATGRLADARQLYRRAVAAAEATGDTASYAQAALGLGGVWVGEHRSPEDGRRYRDIVDRAIARIAIDPSPRARTLEASLRLRRAAERTVVGANILDEGRAALAALRRLGDPDELAAGLSLLHHTMLGPAHAQERVRVATELLDVARSCGNELQTLMGLMWLAVDALLLGRDADQALTELRERADALGMRAILFIVDCVDVMRLMRAGDIESAEAAAVACLQSGQEVGDADAPVYYGAHMLALRWYAGNAVELLDVADELSASTAVPAQNPVFRAVVAALAAEAGDLDRAERALTLLGRERLHEVPPSSSWLLTMFVLVEAAVCLDDSGLAGELYDLLLPFRSLPVMASIGIACFGSAERSLGLAARVGGRIDDAVAHLERGVLENRRLGNRPMTAIARGDLAETLVMRNHADDHARAAAVLGTAIDAAEYMHLDGRMQRWKRVREPIDAVRPMRAIASCVRQGDTWELRADGEYARVPHSVGMGYLAALLDAPGTEIPVGELVGLDLRSPPQDVLDTAALAALRRRMGELENEIDLAMLDDRPDDAASLERDLAEIVSHTRAATGLGGRSRRFDDASERARTSVQKAIRRAIATIGRDAPRLAEVLRESVHTGYRCRYDPGPGAPERWGVRVH